MKRPMTVAATLIAAVTCTILSQAQAARGPAQPMTDAVKSAWASAKKNITESGNVMPEANFAFKPTADVRSFGAILAHIAGANYVFCSAAKGEAAPHAEDEFEKSATTRPAIQKALADSIAYCDAVFNSMDDKKLTNSVDQPFGGGKGPRASALLGNIGHLNEHYGNLVTYFRLKGIVPPSSRR